MAPDEPNLTLYDFLYIDHERVKSLYAQLYSGLLGAIESVAAETLTKTTSAKIGGEPFAGLEYQHGKEELESRLERIDPHDLVLRDVLQGLKEKGFIETDPEAAAPGNIILLNGTISILNFEAYRHFIEIMPHLLGMAPEEASLTGKSKKQRRQSERAKKKEQASVFGVIKGMAEIVPWSLQVIIHTDKMTAWGAIKTENLRDDPGTYTLKYGPTLAGKWYMLGIVDVIEEIQPADSSSLPETISGLMEAARGINSAFGRPDNLVGVTPLLIFRKLIR